MARVQRMKKQLADSDSISRNGVTVWMRGPTL